MTAELAAPSTATRTSDAPSRTVHCCDAVGWLQRSPVLEGASFITSLPDVSELAPITLNEWKSWFRSTAQLVLSLCSKDGVAIFFQTDIKVSGVWVDKAYLIQQAAEDAGHNLLWHKIVCRAPPGKATYSRPAYHHLLCFSKGVKADVHRSTADVLPEAGDTTWARGMGLAACTAACKFVLHHTATRTVVDPFCGHGTVLAAANHLGLNAVGVELSPKRARQAEKLTVKETAEGWTLDKGQGVLPAPPSQQQTGRLQQLQQMGDVQTATAAIWSWQFVLKNGQMLLGMEAVIQQRQYRGLTQPSHMT